MLSYTCTALHVVTQLCMFLCATQLRMFLCATQLRMFLCNTQLRMFLRATQLCMFVCSTQLCMFLCATQLCMFLCNTQLRMFLCATQLCMFLCATQLCMFVCSTQLCMFLCAAQLCMFLCATSYPHRWNYVITITYTEEGGISSYRNVGVCARQLWDNPALFSSSGDRKQSIRHMTFFLKCKCRTQTTFWVLRFLRSLPYPSSAYTWRQQQQQLLQKKVRKFILTLYVPCIMFQCVDKPTRCNTSYE